MTATDTHHAIETVWRIERAKIIAGLTRVLRDVGLAEEFAQEALVSALKHWPVEGVPRNPAAWLMMAGKRRAIDHFRRNKMLERKHGELGYEMEIEQDTGCPRHRRRARRRYRRRSAQPDLHRLPSGAFA